MASPRPPASDLAADIAAGRIDPVYCLCGAERYLVDKALAALRRAVLGDGRAAGFNHDVFDVKADNVGALASTARTLPMMAKRRLVVGKGIDAVKAEHLEILLPYLEDPNPSTCLVLVGDKIDTRFRVFQALRRKGWLHEMKPLPDRELPGWIAHEAKTRGIAIDAEAARGLAEAAGPDLGRLAQALEQLSLYAGPGKPIRLDDVETLVAQTRQRSIFELTKAISGGDRAAALRLLANMLRNREPALRIQFMLARQIRQVWRAKELSAAGAGRGEIAAAVGVPPFAVDEILGPARQMSVRALARSLRRLYQADRTLKSSRVDEDVLLSRLVEAMADDARARPRP